jgi:hypothetical protein
VPQEGQKVTEPPKETTDKEILGRMGRSRYPRFLDDPEEDVYGLDDGEPV